MTLVSQSLAQTNSAKPSSRDRIGLGKKRQEKTNYITTNSMKPWLHLAIFNRDKYATLQLASRTLCEFITIISSILQLTKP
ncbi:hypothetical protein CEXT_353101 [Caerostris extrusa]|uniref:Uncharacterized protein n=1 Tax=Caerostris extrusa TaxID=172846 RepID=A0AAV4Q5F3_CAEEX|nr:hypothetical protein CEXT_353101 [Caerostris extrusa]